MVTVTPALTLDLAELSVRDVNSALRRLPAGSSVRLLSARGQHNLAVGLDALLTVSIEGPAGYYVGGLGKFADITVEGRPAGAPART